MRRSWLVIGAMAAFVAGAPLCAQQPERAPVGPRKARVEAPSEGRLTRIVLNRRARLGVLVSLEPRATDSIGAYLDAVTPGGPAAAAGLRAGDVITRLAGTPVLGPGRGQTPPGQSVPGLRLIELAARLEPNDTIAVEYRRGNERRTATLVTAEEPNVVVESLEGPPAFVYRMDGPRPFVPPDDPRELTGARMQFIYGTPLGDLVLAPLNEELGQYFGTSDGVLVIDAGRSSSLGLKGGDVVLAVDGRRPSSPAHLLRILRTYDSGEPFRLEIMRARRRETVSASLRAPGRSDRN